MLEVFLYRCLMCGNVRCENYDRGEQFYLDQCVGCKDWSDYEKIIIGYRTPKLGESFEMQAVFKIEEKKDGNSNTGTNQET